MATEKHTPGPWHIGGIEGGCRAAIVYSQDGWAICDCKVFHGRSAVEQIQANARLIDRRANAAVPYAGSYRKLRPVPPPPQCVAMRPLSDVHGRH